MKGSWRSLLRLLLLVIAWSPGRFGPVSLLLDSCRWWSSGSRLIAGSGRVAAIPHLVSPVSGFGSPLAGAWFELARRPHEVDRSEAESGLQLALSLRAGGLNKDHFGSVSFGCVCACVCLWRQSCKYEIV